MINFESRSSVQGSTAYGIDGMHDAWWHWLHVFCFLNMKHCRWLVMVAVIVRMDCFVIRDQSFRCSPGGLVRRASYVIVFSLLKLTMIHRPSKRKKGKICFLSPNETYI